MTNFYNVRKSQAHKWNQRCFEFLEIIFYLHLFRNSLLLFYLGEPFNTCSLCNDPRIVNNCLVLFFLIYVYKATIGLPKDQDNYINDKLQHNTRTILYEKWFFKGSFMKCNVLSNKYTLIFIFDLWMSRIIYNIHFFCSLFILTILFNADTQ